MTAPELRTLHCLAPLGHRLLQGMITLRCRILWTRKEWYLPSKLTDPSLRGCFHSGLPNCHFESTSFDRNVVLFIRYTEYRAKREQEHQAWLERKKEREEKMARGEEVGPEEEDPTAEVEIGCLGLFKFIVYCFLGVVLAGKFFTGSYLWEQDLPNLSKYFPPVRVNHLEEYTCFSVELISKHLQANQRLFSEQVLATYDGTVESRPIYLAVSQ